MRTSPIIRIKLTNAKEVGRRKISGPVAIAIAHAKRTAPQQRSRNHE